MQVPEPLAVRDIALPARDVLDVARVDEDHLEAARVEDLEDGNPVDAGRFHRHVRDAARRQPVGEAVEIAGEGRERLHRVGVAIGGTATKCSADPQSMPAACGWSRSRAWGDVTGLGRRTTALAFHGRLLYTGEQPPGTGMRMRGNLLNGITPRQRRVTSDDNKSRVLALGGTRPSAEHVASLSAPCGALVVQQPMRCAPFGAWGAVAMPGHGAAGHIGTTRRPTRLGSLRPAYCGPRLIASATIRACAAGDSCEFAKNSERCF